MKTIKNYIESDLTLDHLLKQNKKNVLDVSTFEKITLNIGVKEANYSTNKMLEPLLILKLITNQQPTYTKSKKSISNFKLRDGKIIGCKVTLRKKTKEAFLEKLIHLILPQIIESTSLKYKNRRPKNHVTLGINDCNIFIELENLYETLKSTSGLEMTLSTKNRKQSPDNLVFSGIKIKFQ